MEISRVNYNKKNNIIAKLNKIRKSTLDTNKKEKYKTTAFNIDSSLRNKDPKNITDDRIFNIKENNFKFSQNNSIIEISLDNSDEYFKINDRIIITNFETDKIYSMNCIFLIKNFNYAIVKIENHQLFNSIEDQHIKINILDDINNMIGNIPINSLKESKKIYFYNELKDELIKNNLDLLIKDTFNTDTFTFEKNIIFIKLPSYFSTNQESIVELKNLCELEFDSVAGIPISYINADYPISFKNNKGYHQIVDISEETILIDLGIISNNSINFNKDHVKIKKIIKTLEGFIDSSYYIIDLPKNFNNVVRIELLSSEFYFVDNLIKDYGTNKNNTLYWQNIEDGDTIYKIELESGNYTPSNLLQEILNKANILPRVNHTPEIPSYNNFEIDLNVDKQIITFLSFKYELLPESLSVELITINNEFYYQLTVNHPNNYVEEDDIIEISGSTSVGIAPAGTLNSKHNVYRVDKANNNYSIILSSFTILTSFVSSKGGDAIVIKSKNLTRFLFDKKNTFGDILGFKNVGHDNSITNYNHITTNKDDYNIPKKFNSIGNIDNTLQYFNFTGTNLYLLMYLNDYESINNSGQIPNSFAKILLPGTLGDAIFNSYVNHPVEFNIPITNIDQFVVRFSYPNGTQPVFSNLEHSFTVLITEKKDTHVDLGTQSKDSSFTKKLYEIKSQEF